MPLQNWVKQLADYVILTEFDAPDLEFAWADDRSADPAIAASIATDYVKCGIKTVNEARGELGLTPVPGGDQPLIITPQGPVPLDGMAESIAPKAPKARGKTKKAVAKAAEKLERFNPNHYGPGPLGGQFAPAGDNGASGGSASSRNQTQVTDNSSHADPANDANADGIDQGNPQFAQEIPLFARPPIVPDDEVPEFQEPIPRLSGQEGAKDIPSWARGMRPYVGENGRDFAERLLDQKYGPGNWNEDYPEYKQLQKYGDRSFRDPKSIVLPDDDGA